MGMTLILHGLDTAGYPEECFEACDRDDACTNFSYSKEYCMFRGSNELAPVDNDIHTFVKSTTFATDAGSTPEFEAQPGEYCGVYRTYDRSSQACVDRPRQETEYCDDVDTCGEDLTCISHTCQYGATYCGDLGMLFENGTCAVLKINRVTPSSPVPLD